MKYTKVIAVAALTSLAVHCLFLAPHLIFPLLYLAPGIYVDSIFYRACNSNVGKPMSYHDKICAVLFAAIWPLIVLALITNLFTDSDSELVLVLNKDVSKLFGGRAVKFHAPITLE